MPKNIDEIIRESIKLRAPFQHFATVIISDQGIIQGISQSKPNNLILDNFGTWLAGLINAPAQAVKTVSLKDLLGNARNLKTRNVYTEYAFSEYSPPNDSGTLLQVGGGTTPATRADYQIETALSVAPEDDVFGTGTGSYSAGVVSAGGAITAGGTETINEVGFFGFWTIVGGAAAYAFMLFHDILVSGEAFTPGQTITVAYSINL